MELPSYFSALVMAKCANPNKMTIIEFNQIWWKQLANKEREKRAFLLLSSDPNKKFITTDDFKKLFK